MANTDSFVFYRSFFDSIEELNDEDRLTIYDAICKYALYHTETEFNNSLTKAFFTLIKPQLDANFKRRHDGNKGGRPRKSETQSSEELEDKVNENHRLSKTKTTGYVNEKPNVNVNVNENVNANVNKSSHFVKPTVNEVREYCNSRHNAVDPEEFVDFYQSKNWMVGKNRMVDWKAAVRTWERNSISKTNMEIDNMPIYDASRNKKMSETEINELLALRND